jgi:superfamily II DNA or RNA helicase
VSSSSIVGGGQIARFSSRSGRLDHVFLRDRLAGAASYDRICGYFRSSIFELVNEEIETIGRVRMVCNADLDPRDLRTAQLVERWNRVDDELATLLERPRYQRLFDLLRAGNLEIRVVARGEAPFVHGKAGVIRRPDGAATAFVGSLNETREGFAGNYEIVWEDSSADGVAWVQAEFDALWDRGVDLPDVIIEEIGRSARKRQVELESLAADEVAPAALVEAPIYRKGEELKPWQRSFVGIFLQHRETYGRARLLLADEVGVGKTLSLAASALVACLQGDGPALILCPATLCQQWQAELWEKLGIPSAVWLSQKKQWRDHTEHLIRTRGAEDVARCPYQIGIVSTGLIFQETAEREALLGRSYGTLVLDEAHRARTTRGIGAKAGEPNNLLKFMQEAAPRARHVLLGTATPIQTDVEELWDLLGILNRGADHVLGRSGSQWRKPKEVLPLLTGLAQLGDEDAAWRLFRNPLPPASESAPLFDQIRTDLEIPAGVFFTSKHPSDLSQWTRDSLVDSAVEALGGTPFIQQNSPLVRHVVLRRRSGLENAGLIPKIAVDIWPIEGSSPPMFDGVALRTAPEFDRAYDAADRFTKLLGQRKQSAGFMRTLLLQRICSSYASGAATAQRLLDRKALPEAEDDQAPLGLELTDLVDKEREILKEMLHHLSSRPTDPKLDAVVYFLLDKGWLEHGSIVFSQYYDTALWIAQDLAARMPSERLAVYAGAGGSCVFYEGERRTVEREQIKAAVRDRQVRLVVATDAACEGLNLQTLGTLINVDLPWNPSRLEQRIGRIKRYGQSRDRVDMLNLVYQGSHDERVYAVLSKRMEDRYNLLGTLPDVIEDAWIDDIEALEEHLSQFTHKKQAANAFDLRYANSVEPEGPDWERCEKVLARRDVVERLSQGW